MYIIAYRPRKGKRGASMSEQMNQGQRSPQEYARITGMTSAGEVLEALPLMDLLLGRWGNMGDIRLTLAMAYRTGIADGKRLDRGRRHKGLYNPQTKEREG
jgi:hypothetical protein